MQIRNIAIIAHVDHGKTTLTDALLRQNGMVKDDSQSMDSNALEQERGITIYAKNTALYYKDTKINIVDTPGHADFGSEVERVLRSIDSVLLIVDAQEGPMPQTKFVLKKSLELGLKPIVVINKVDKPAARPEVVHEMVLELFMDLGANDQQLDFVTVYAVGVKGLAMKNLGDESENLNPLLDTVLENVKLAENDTTKPFRMQPFNLGYDNYLGRLAVGRIYEGIAKSGSKVYIKNNEGVIRTGTITKLFSFEGFEKTEVSQAMAGDIVMIAGIPDIYIGETISSVENPEALPAITVDEPTISVDLFVNNSPFAGKEGKFVTTRQIRDRLEKELEVNVGLKVDYGDGDFFRIFGRGEMHIAVLLENMRREGFEMQVAQPQVIIKEEDGVKLEPFEELSIDIPDAYTGVVIEKVSKLKGQMIHMGPEHGLTRLIFEIPTRGLLGYRGQFIMDTRGEGIMAARVIGFKPHVGNIEKRELGAMVSMIAGKALGYALFSLQERGTLYINPNVDVYEGQIIGNVSKGNDLMVNPTKGKKLSNVRASGTDDAITLTPPFDVSLERGLEILAEDEYLEITPMNIRLRKKVLREGERKR